MRRSFGPLVVLLFVATQSAASAADTMTVQSLMSSGYTVAGIISSPAGGASIFLQKGTTLVFCYTTEHTGSAALETQYCKPVK